YRSMDFSTRDRYRHAVETISRHSSISETDVAQKAIQLTAASAENAADNNRKSHVGYFLIDKGQPELEQAVHVHWDWPVTIERLLKRFPLAFYAGGVVLLCSLLTFGLVRYSASLQVSQWKLFWCGLLFF